MSRAGRLQWPQARRGESIISTIEDVARLAGVSRGSVSNVLTGKVRMRDATRERVLEAARTLGYRPNRVASALASGRYPSIALLTADITNLVNADIVKAVEAVCTPRAYTVTICHTDKDVDRERAHLDDLLGHRAAGLIAKAEGAETTRYRRLLDAGTRIVLIDNPILDLDLPIVRLDRRDGHPRGAGEPGGGRARADRRDRDRQSAAAGDHPDDRRAGGSVHRAADGGAVRGRARPGDRDRGTSAPVAGGRA